MKGRWKRNDDFGPFEMKHKPAILDLQRNIVVSLKTTKTVSVLTISLIHGYVVTISLIRIPTQCPVCLSSLQRLRL
jgi:hypothetical protein